MLNKIKYGNKSMNIVIILSFLFLSFLNIIILLHYNHIFMIFGEDTQFHWNRIASLLQDGLLSKYALSSFSNNGSAVMTMYPYLFLYPFALFFKFTKSIYISTVLIYFINTFMLLNICFYSSLGFSKSRYISFIFAVTYSISAYLFIFNFVIYDIGMVYSYIVMPLILFGFLYWLNNNKWLMLAIGIVLLIYSNVIISVTTPMILLIYMIVEFNKLTKTKIINLFKAIILSLMLSSLFWIPMFKLYISNVLVTPYWKHIIAEGLGIHLLQLPFPSFIGDKTLTIYAVLGIIMGVILLVLNKINTPIKKIYIVSVCIFIFCSKIIPWNYFNRVITGSIQYTGRLLLLPQVVLIYVLSISINILLKHFSYNKSLILLGISLIILSQLTFQGIFIKEIKQGKFIGSYITKNSVALNEIYDKSSTDYYPKTSYKFKYLLLKDRGIVTLKNNKSFQIKVDAKGHGKFKFHIPNNTKNIILPFLRYNGTNYKCKLDNKNIPIESNHQVIMIKDINPGVHFVHIRVIQNKFDIISEILTSIGMSLYILIYCKRYKGSKS